MRVSTLVSAALATGTSFVSAKSPLSYERAAVAVPGAYILELDHAEVRVPVEHDRDKWY